MRGLKESRLVISALFPLSSMRAAAAATRQPGQLLPRVEGKYSLKTTKILTESVLFILNNLFLRKYEISF